MRVIKLNILKTFFVLAVMLSFAGQLNAQQTAKYLDPDKEYKLALELYNKEKFSNSRRSFEKAKNNPGAHSEIHANCEFYIAICAMELFHQDAEDKLLAFIKNYPENPRLESLNFTWLITITGEKNIKMPPSLTKWWIFMN